MSPPPSSTPTPLVPLAEGSRTGFRPAHLSVEVLLREAHKVLTDLGVNMSTRRVHRAIQSFVRDGRSVDEFYTWFLVYADPTGEAAIRNVMRENRSCTPRHGS